MYHPPRTELSVEDQAFLENIEKAEELVCALMREASDIHGVTGHALYYALGTAQLVLAAAIQMRKSVPKTHAGCHARYIDDMLRKAEGIYLKHARHWNLTNKE